MLGIVLHILMTACLIDSVYLSKSVMTSSPNSAPEGGKGLITDGMTTTSTGRASSLLRMTLALPLALNARIASFYVLASRVLLPSVSFISLLNI